MSLQALIREVKQSGSLDKLAAQFGIDPSTADQLADMLAPTIGSAAKRRIDHGDAQAVLSQLRGQDRARYWQSPEAASEPEAMQAGENFLEAVFGSREATNSVAEAAADRAGAQPAQVASFLPAIAAVLQGAMQERAPDAEIDNVLAGSSNMGAAGGGGLMGMVASVLGGGASQGGLSQIASMLDADKDGSPLDDILGRFMKR